MKQVGLLLMIPLLIGLVGCSSQDFGRPIGRVGDVVDSGKAYLEDSSGEEAMRRATQLAAILAEWELQKQTVDDDYTLGPDDVLTVGVLSLETPEKVATLMRTISKDGTVTLPLVGAVECAGSTAREFQERVVDAYQGKYLQEPQVDVAVTEYRSAPVVVTGAVGKPGVYYLRHNQSSVLEVLSMANGLNTDAGNDLLIVRRRIPVESVTDSSASEKVVAPELAKDLAAKPDPAPPQPEPWTGSHIAERVAALEAEEDVAWSEEAEPPELQVPAPPMISEDSEAIVSTLDERGEEIEADVTDLNADLITVDLEGLLDRGDVRLNLPVVGGDIVTVPPGRREYVYVLGYVQRPGAFDLESRKRVRALQAVAMAGGLSGAARAQNSFLIIDKPNGRKVVSIDLTKIARGSRPPVYMESGNTLVVGSSMVGKLAEFIRPTASVGASLTPGQ